jgi:hypothetical protein
VIATRNRYGCGPQPTAPPPPTWLDAGKRSCAVSISNTPSGCSNRPWAGPSRRSELRKQPTGGRGWSSRLHPASSRPPARRRPAPTLGETGPAGPTDTGPGPPRVSKPPPTHHPARQRSETLPTRSRTPTRVEEHHTGNPPRRRKDQHTRPHHDRASQAHRLKIKLRASLHFRHAVFAISRRRSRDRPAPASRRSRLTVARAETRRHENRDSPS